MNADKLDELILAAMARRRELQVSKGREYTQGAEDRLANFKRIAADLDLDPLDVWWVYYRKHQDALLSYVVFGRESSSEGVEGRIDDMQVYLDLARGLVHERKEGGRPPRRLSEFQRWIGEWQAKTFGGGADRIAPIARHLSKEAAELEVEVSTCHGHDTPALRSEAADIFILLAGLAHRVGFDLADAVREKMAVNQGRTWGAPGADGIIEHLEA